VAAGADYLGCGAIYPTGSKADAGEAIGLARLDQVARAVADLARPGDLVITLGAGSIGVVPGQIVDELERRHGKEPAS
jgi:UDP-N-acetylmuramate--alanine ligase